jgi:exoribonuclease R
MFVEFEDKVDGLVRLDSMQGFWKISEDSLKITSNGKSYVIGQKVRAKIVGANKFEHKIDLVIMDNHY